MAKTSAVQKNLKELSWLKNTLKKERLWRKSLIIEN